MEKNHLIICLCMLPLLLTACQTDMTLREVFDEVSEIERFKIETYDCDLYRFPDKLGDATVCIHPNSSQKKRVMALLGRLPKEWLAYEAQHDGGQLERYYYAPNMIGDNLLYVYIGRRSADTVLILFSNVSEEIAKKFLVMAKELTDRKIKERQEYLDSLPNKIKL